MNYLSKVTIVLQLCTYVMQSPVFCRNKISAQCSSSPSQWSVASTRQTQSFLQFLLPHKLVNSSKEIVIVIIKQSNLRSPQNYVFQGSLLPKECFYISSVCMSIDSTREKTTQIHNKHINQANIEAEIILKINLKINPLLTKHLPKKFFCLSKTAPTVLLKCG